MSEKKKMYSRKEFEDLRVKSAIEMAKDDVLQRDALDLLIRADKYRWIHQTTWMGEPLLNLPQDMFAIQEIIFKTKPKYIIEVGVAWGGGLLFYSTLLQAWGGSKAIGIDIYIPDDLREGSSLDENTLIAIKNILKGSKEVLVILDSHHTHDHVLKELQLYSEFVGLGHYIICADTIVDLIPEQEHRLRPWGPGNNPMLP